MAGRTAELLEELRRRRVGRVAVAYAVGAWVLVQVADIVFPRLGLPESLVTLLIVVAIAGFPVALVLSWFFAVVPESAGDRWNPAPVWVRAGVVVLVAVVAVGSTLRVWPRLMEGPIEVRSLAVLPFDNLSADAEQEYLAAGMQDALITELAQIGSVRIVSRTSTLRFRGTDRPLAEVARELGVDALVEASVLRIGDRLRIQAQLIRPLPRERHLWAEGYDRGTSEVLGVHSEMARGIAGAIRARLTPDEAERLATSRAVNPEAYEAYLRGMYFLNQQTPAGYERGLSYLLDAIALDPADAAAYAGLAMGYSVIGHGTIPDAYERAKAAAARALELDSTNAAAHEALAEIALYRDWDWPTAEREFRRVLALNPNLPEAAAHYGWYLDLKERPAEALQSMRRAQRLDPLNALWAAWSGWLVLDADPESALQFARSALELNPNHPHALYVAANAAARLGLRAEALEWTDALQAMPTFRWGAAVVHAMLGNAEEARAIATELESQPTPMNAFGIALVYSGLGEKERALDWLEEAERLRFSWMPWIHRRAVFQGLEDEPRFHALLRKLDLPGPRAVAAGR